MRRRKHLSIKSVTVAGIASSVLLALGAVTLNAPPAGAVVYCQYVDYPHGCVARAGVVLRPRPVARAAVRAQCRRQCKRWRQSRWRRTVKRARRV